MLDNYNKELLLVIYTENTASTDYAHNKEENKKSNYY